MANQYQWYGGRHGEAASLRGLLAQAGVRNPASGEPLSEPLCFGLAGGIGAGYSFCPSIPRHGVGSGVAIIGRHKLYATGADWYQDCCDRLGIKTRLTETAAAGKALANLQSELAAGRPAAVWCSKTMLPFLHDVYGSCGYWMHSFVITRIDADRGLAYGADAAPGEVTIGLAELAAARAGVCSHKNRTLTIEPPAKPLTAATLKGAVLEGIRACLGELYQKPRMKTFSLSGLEILAGAIASDKSKEGWLKVFSPGQLYLALRDAFHSIETGGTGGGLYRLLFADFLAEAAEITGRKALAESAERYRGLAQQWTALPEAMLPTKIKPLAETRRLLVKKEELYRTKGMKADKQLADLVGKLRTLATSMNADPPLDSAQARELLAGLREQIIALHAAELSAAEELAAQVSIAKASGQR